MPCCRQLCSHVFECVICCNVLPSRQRPPATTRTQKTHDIKPAHHNRFQFKNISQWEHARTSARKFGPASGAGPGPGTGKANIIFLQFMRRRRRNSMTTHTHTHTLASKNTTFEKEASARNRLFFASSKRNQRHTSRVGHAANPRATLAFMALTFD